MERSHGWIELQSMRLQNGSSARAFKKGDCGVLITLEEHGKKPRWHLSISCQNRWPTWEEIKDARYTLLPNNLTFAQILPPPGDYINIHPNCFHLWEIDDGEW